MNETISVNLQVHRTSNNTKGPTIWREFIVSPSRKFCYLIVPKCGSNSYRKAMKKAGWTSEQQDPKVQFYFAHIDDPVKRYVRGFVQYCLAIQQDPIQVLLYHDSLFPGIYDNHTMPISLIWADKWNAAHFFDLQKDDVDKWLKEKYNVDVPRVNTAEEEPQKAEWYKETERCVSEKMGMFKSLFHHDIIRYQQIKPKPSPLFIY